MKKPTILLVEDDNNISDSLVSYLETHGYDVHWASTLSQAQAKLAQAPELMILDWMLPDGQGLDYLKEFRLNGNKIPVIMLTAKNELIDKVLGLESGADDYMTKPFEPRELLSRIRVRLRELSQIQKSSQIRVSGIEIDSEKRSAKYLGQNLILTKLEFDLLHLLVTEPGRVFTRESLLNKVWGFENFPTTRTVDNHIVQLRQKTEPEFFETVRGIGYRFVTRNK